MSSGPKRLFHAQEAYYPRLLRTCDPVVDAFAYPRAKGPVKGNHRQPNTGCNRHARWLEEARGQSAGILRRDSMAGGGGKTQR